MTDVAAPARLAIRRASARGAAWTGAKAIALLAWGFVVSLTLTSVAVVTALFIA